jgi:hypothetical protein
MLLSATDYQQGIKPKQYRIQPNQPLLHSADLMEESHIFIILTFIYTVVVQGDQNVSVHLMITVQ